MSKIKVQILPDNINVLVEKNLLISDILHKEGVNLNYPCGQKGTCGRCKLYVNDKEVLACKTKIDVDTTIKIPDNIRLSGQTILTNIELYEHEENKLPRVEKICLKLSEPTLDDQTSDTSRLKLEIANYFNIDISKVKINPLCLRDLPILLRENDFRLCVNIVHEDDVIRIFSFSEEPVYGIAVDIGTTTIAVALCDLLDGSVLDVVGSSNPQAEFGSDVISRIVYTEEDKQGLEIMRTSVTNALNEAINILSENTNISSENFFIMVISANTVMSHFLLGIHADYLRREPYIPAISEYPILTPLEMDLSIAPNGQVFIVPSVSSYVGGDIVSGVIATELYKQEGFNMLVDVGTNGEMVLSGDGFMLACSCSAGPAFEGSGISCGSRAVKGAIDNVFYHHGHIVYDVIGGPSVEAQSICGSGLISLLSALLEKKVIDRSGRFVTKDKFYYVTSKVFITEADVQNIIRSKAAIFAGMKLLANHLELELKDMQKIYIAGGFGRHLNIKYATNIGMLPQLNISSFDYVGNSSLAGSLKILNDRSIDFKSIASNITNIELSIGNEFMDEFMQACFLPHTDFSLFEVN